MVDGAAFDSFENQDEDHVSQVHELIFSAELKNRPSRQRENAYFATTLKCSCIEQAFQNNPAIAIKAIKNQFDKLLLQPLIAVNLADSSSIPTVVIVIDALDECDGDNDIQLILQLLPYPRVLSSIHIRLFLTSRPELVIRLGFSKIPTHDHQDLILNDIPRELIKQDTSLFLTRRSTELKEELELSRPLPEDWLGETDLQRLVAIPSFPLFIIAATICRMLKDHSWDPIDSLAEILLRCNTSNI
ncbi:hypothetical protein N7493_005662 [Penicillium malachiteum]|uniref:Nephrocystin 3-like N-terminal domain-containing protein n=1 Tax=Penicillium malachiteum TaxID=1324776 RepID=A0AAD6MX09_9EURO|nr:hypothetical protein N7493_005662 [Penicillium malachiteum]